MSQGGAYLFDPADFWARAKWRLSRLWGGGHPGDEPWDIAEDGEMIGPDGEVAPIKVYRMAVGGRNSARAPET